MSVSNTKVSFPGRHKLNISESTQRWFYIPNFVERVVTAAELVPELADGDLPAEDHDPIDQMVDCFEAVLPSNTVRGP